MSGKFHEAVLFSKCVGLNDSSETTDVLYNADGVTALRSCLNVTVTAEGKLIKIPAKSTVLTTTENIVELVANDRLFIQSGVSLKLYNGTTATEVTNSPMFNAGVKAKYISTPIDTRICINETTHYKIAHSSNAVVEAILGAYSGPYTPRVFSKMPMFDCGFVYGAKLFVQSGKFLLHSENYHYDTFAAGDNHIGSSNAVYQAGQIPGCVLTVHENGVVAYVGQGIKTFKKVQTLCTPLEGTLYSGYIDALGEYAHVFLCKDGVHVVGSDGKLIKVSGLNTRKLDTLNTLYNTVTVENGKYLAYGNLLCVEYDFQNKAVLLRDTLGITSSCMLGKKVYYGSAKTLCVTDLTTPATVTSTSVKLPYSDFGVPGDKQVRFLYFTGTITGTATFTVRNQYGETATKIITNPGYVQNFKIDGLRLCKGPKLSVEITVDSGSFKLEELRTAFLLCSSRQ